MTVNVVTLPCTLSLLIRHIGVQPFLATSKAMQSFTDQRTSNTQDEIWLLEHPPVYTLGQAGDPAHIISSGDIPVVQSDRGGQVTYHGPGQLVMYVLLDIARLKISVRSLVMHLQQAVIDMLAQYHLPAYARADAPGVYVMVSTGEAKIAALGLRVRRGRTYHGLAINVTNDLSPFRDINPCGYTDMAVTRLLDCLPLMPDVDTLSAALIQRLTKSLGYNDVINTVQLPCELNNV